MLMARSPEKIRKNPPTFKTLSEVVSLKQYSGWQRPYVLTVPALQPHKKVANQYMYNSKAP